MPPCRSPPAGTRPPSPGTRILTTQFGMHLSWVGGGVVGALGRRLPAGVMIILVVYLLKDVSLSAPTFGAVHLAPVAVTAGAHLWRRSMLLCMAAGTATYAAMLALLPGGVIDTVPRQSVGPPGVGVGSSAVERGAVAGEDVVAESPRVAQDGVDVVHVRWVLSYSASSRGPCSR